MISRHAIFPNRNQIALGIKSIILLVLAMLIAGILLPQKSNAQNNSGNPWLNWVPELGNGPETPKGAFGFSSVNNKLTATVNNSCNSYGIGNDKRGYVYYGDNGFALIRAMNPVTKSLLGSFGYNTGSAGIVHPHSFKCFYVAATQKYYLAISNVGNDINTGSAIVILDVTTPGAMTLVKTISVPASVGFGTRVSGMDAVQTGYTSAGTTLYAVVDDGSTNGNTNATGGLCFKVTDPLSASPAISGFRVRYTSSYVITYAHSIKADPVNDRLYICSSINGSANNGDILSFKASTFAPTYNVYRPLEPDATQAAITHTIALNNAGTVFYTGGAADAGGNVAYKFNVASDKTSSTITVINQSARSPVLNYNGETAGNVMGVDLLPDDSKLYVILEHNGNNLNTSKIFELDPGTLANIGTIQNLAGTADAVFGRIDPHSFAYTLHDFGDAPASYGVASHFLANDDYIQDRLRIGATIDGDSISTFTYDCKGDDLHQTPKTNDEDGISSATKAAAAGFYYGQTGTFSINSIPVKNTTSPSVTANLFGWVDFNHDGLFQTSESATASVPNGTTSVNLSWTIPANVSTGPVIVRLRLSSDPSLRDSTASSAVFDGEVEDHRYADSILLAGNVFNDINGNYIYGTAGSPGSGETAANPGVALYAYLIKGGIIIDSSVITAAGAYAFPHAPRNAGAASVVIGTNSVAPGSAATGIVNIATTPPAGWVYTGLSSSTIPNGTASSLNVLLSTTPITQQNFGLERLPESAVSTQTAGVNPGGTVNTTIAPGSFVTSNVGANPNTKDYDGGTVDQIRITSFPTNATSIAIGTTTYYANPASVPGTCPTATCLAWPGAGVTIAAPGGSPASTITVDPVNGGVSVVIPFAAIDNAGKADPTPGSVTVTYSSIALPVTLLSFTAYNTENCTARISWSTGSEDQVDRFEIERSPNASGFKSIITTLPAGNNSTYTVFDSEVLKGATYYRLRSIDKGGAYQLSGIVKLNSRCGTGNDINVYPNPAADEVNITGFDLKEMVTVQLVDATGKLVFKQQYEGKAIITIDIKMLPDGFYQLKAFSNTKMKTAKLIKLNGN